MRGVGIFFSVQLAHARCGRLLIFSHRPSVVRISFSDGLSVVISIFFSNGPSVVINRFTNQQLVANY
jgi:hypothetical protein